MNPVELLYYIGYTLKKRYALAHQRRLPHRVISIGNITIGGTGKTPATIAVAGEAVRRGLHPVILTRGYGGKAKGPCFIGSESLQGSPQSCSRQPLDPMLCGDEPLLMAERLRDVPIVKCADRHAGGSFALQFLPAAQDGPFVFILDDGFQHWRLYRDRDILLVDGMDPFGNRRLFPLGPLREPLQELRRADLFVVTKRRNEELVGELRTFNARAPILFSDYRIAGLRDALGNDVPLETLGGSKIYAFCGIAHPEAFRETLASLSGEVIGFKAFRDHYRYAQADIAYLEGQCRKQGGTLLLATEKDMVKLRQLRVPRNVLFLRIDFTVDGAFFDFLFGPP